MFGIGMPELIVIFVIALVILGPAELPKLAKNLGRLMAEFKRTSDDLMSQIHQELDAVGTEEAKIETSGPAPPEPASDLDAGARATEAPAGSPVSSSPASDSTSPVAASEEGAESPSGAGAPTSPPLAAPQGNGEVAGETQAATPAASRGAQGTA